MTSSTSSSRDAVKLLLNIGLLALIVIMINQIVMAFLPYPWGEPKFKNKYDHYLANQHEYDTLFIGSSLTDRHIDPAVFDQEVAGSQRLHSYNLGADGNYFPKAYLTLKDLLANRPENLKLVFFELMISDDLPEQKNWHTTRQVYWYDLDTTLYLLKSLWQSDVGVMEKLSYSTVHTGFLLEKNLNFGFGIDMARHFLNVLLQSGGKPETKNGFLPLDVNIEMAAAQGIITEDLIQRRDYFFSNTERLSSLTETSRLLFDNPELWATYSEAHLEKLTEMQALASEQGIELIFVLPPRIYPAHRAYEKLLPLFYALPKTERIELVDPKRYPELYSLENSFDISHFNSTGAEIYTRLLARKFIVLKDE
jgi:hypothetical protein